VQLDGDASKLISADSETGATSAETLAALFQEFMLRTPYTSVSAYYKHCAGIPPDPRYGDNCVGQALALGELMTREGFEVRYLRDGRHLALLCQADGSTFYVDPYLMPLSPVPLFGPGSQAASPAVPAFPLCADRKGRLMHATLRFGHCPRRRKLFVRYSRFASRRGSHVQSRAFEFALDEPCRPADLAVEDLHALLFHREQNNLSIRAIHRREFCMIELIYPFGNGLDEEVNRGRLLVRRNADLVIPYADRRFWPHVEKLARNLNATLSEIVDYVLEGVCVYRKYAPPGISFSPYEADIP
jgi:hypothetical protein